MFPGETKSLAIIAGLYCFTAGLKEASEALNKDTMDAAAPLGNGEMTILNDMESMDQEHEQYVQSLKGGSHRA